MPPQNIELTKTGGSSKEKDANYTVAKANGENDNQEPTKATIVIPPDGGFGWIVMIASFFCNLIVDGIVFSFGFFREDMVRDLDSSTSTIALVGSLLSGCYLIFGPIVSALTNRYGFRAVTILGSVISSLAFGLSYFATSPIHLHILYGVFGGIGFCFIYMPSVIIVGYYFEKWRPLATGIALCGSGVGTFTMAPLCQYLIKVYGWRVTLVIQAGLILSCSIFGLAYLPIEPTVISDINEDEKEKKSLMGDSLHSPAFKTPEGRFAYSVPNSSHSTWIGTANNTNYPTAAEIFKGSGANLDRRPSQNSGMLNQGNISSTTKKLEQFKQAQKRPGRFEMSPTTPESIDFPAHPPSVLSSNHHELGPVGEAEEVEENESGNLLNKEVKPTVVANSGRRHTVSGRQKGTESLTGSRKGSKADVSRPLYRDDIFFSGSMHKLPQYRSQTSIGYHMSVTHIPTFKDVEEEDNDDSCKLCPEAVRRTLSTMLDLSLLKDVSFLFLIFSGFFTMMGFFVPFLYITDRAKKQGIDATTAGYFVSSIGVANTIARILFGWLSSFEGVNALHLNNIFITAGGLTTMFSGYFMEVHQQYIYTAVFGLACACFSALRSIIVVDLLGLDKLTNAYGIILLLQGIAATLGSPLAGFLYEYTKSYTAPFMVAGGLIFFSAVLTYPLNIIKNWQRAKDSRRKIGIAA